MSTSNKLWCGFIFLVLLFMFALPTIGSRVGIMTQEADGDPASTYTWSIKFPNGSYSIANNIGTLDCLFNESIIEPDLNADNAPAEDDVLTYDATGTNFAWLSPAELQAKFTAGSYTDDSVNSADINWADIGNQGEDGIATDYALAADADAGDFDVHSTDGIYGASDTEYIDMGGDLIDLTSDTLIQHTSAEHRFRVDDAAYLSIVTTDGGETTISVTSDGDDNLTLGDDSDDNIIIEGQNFTVNSSGNMWVAGTFTAAANNDPYYTFLDLQCLGTDKDIARIGGNYLSGADGAEDGSLLLETMVGGSQVEFARLDGELEKIVVSKPIQLDDNTSVSIEGGADAMDDHEHNGILVEGLDAGEAIAIFETVFIANDTDPIKLANAVAAGGTYPAFGIAVAAASDEAPVKILVRGIIRDETWAGLTPGAPIYLGETGNETLGGMVTVTPPATANDCVQIIGWAVSASEIYFDFSRPYQLVE